MIMNSFKTDIEDAREELLKIAKMQRDAHQKLIKNIIHIHGKYGGFEEFIKSFKVNHVTIENAFYSEDMSNQISNIFLSDLKRWHTILDSVIDNDDFKRLLYIIE